MVKAAPSGPRTAFALSQLGSYVSDAFASAVREVGLSPSEAGVLRLLSREPGLSQRELANRLGTQPSRVVALVDGLEGRGLVVRRRSETDRRNYELHPTDDARALGPRLRALAEAHEEAVLAPLTSREREELARLVGKLIAGHGLDAQVHRETAPTRPA
ncbi:MarR family winged helix-turn-helix transcriptional regulator [Luteimicrobium sp. DT211]|uniref:MarR family winged helix-turn-helix transcriptional regulator n=1 Tax=Luteimicrobium sp. DT211 TaxID=3393412 RepID=UPI003CF8ECC3